MSEHRRARHIRDIAHLYLSHSVPARRRMPLNIYITASTRDCFSSLHVANLAVALADRSDPLCVYEFSGLLPNVAYHLSYPPAVYLSRNQEEDAWLLGPRSLRLALSRAALPQSDTGDGEIRLIHLPPIARGLAAEDCYRHVSQKLTGSSCLITLLDQDGPQVTWPDIEVPIVSTFVLNLVPSVKRGNCNESLGFLGDWRRHVGDRTPVVLQHPGSPIAREYLSICEALVNRIHLTRRLAGAGAR